MGRYTSVDKKYFEKQKEERIGMTNINHQGFKMTIVEYYSSTKIMVEFEDGFRKQGSYKSFQLGTICHSEYKYKRFRPLEEERLKEIRINKEGFKMFIKEYNGANDIVVEFEDEFHTQVHTAYKCFDKGNVKNPNKRGKYGEVTGNKYKTKEDGTHTKDYSVWRGILNRVFEPEKHNNTRSYKEVAIAEEWLFFDNFVEWLHSQENYEKWKNDKEYKWDIDKDILSNLNNKIYSPETCCLVPAYINRGLIRQIEDSRDLPIGVYKQDNKYFCQLEKKKYFDTIQEAETAYKEYKNRHRKEVAELAYQKGDITKRCYEALMDDNFIYR